MERFLGRSPYPVVRPGRWRTAEAVAEGVAGLEGVPPEGKVRREVNPALLRGHPLFPGPEAAEELPPERGTLHGLDHADLPLGDVIADGGGGDGIDTHPILPDYTRYMHGVDRFDQRRRGQVRPEKS